MYTALSVTLKENPGYLIKLLKKTKTILLCFVQKKNVWEPRSKNIT